MASPGSKTTRTSRRSALTGLRDPVVILIADQAGIQPPIACGATLIFPARIKGDSQTQHPLMNPNDILDLFKLLLALGIVICGVATFVKPRNSRYFVTPDNAFLFPTQALLTVFLALQTAEYSQKQDTFMFAAMLLGLCFGLVGIIVAYFKKGQIAANQAPRANP